MFSGLSTERAKDSPCHHGAIAGWLDGWVMALASCPQDLYEPGKISIVAQVPQWLCIARGEIVQIIFSFVYLSCPALQPLATCGF